MISAAASVTIIVPCYNEEEGLPVLLGRLSRMRAHGALDWHCLFVDDGSSDGTFGVLLRAAQACSWVEVIRHHENLGLGAALRTGFEQSCSPIVCTIDSDCTYPPEQLPELVALVRAGAEIATASAWHPGSAVAEGSALRLWLSRMVSAVYKMLLGQDVYTFTCLFRAYDAGAIRRIRFRSNGFTHSRFLRGLSIADFREALAALIGEDAAGLVTRRLFAARTSTRVVIRSFRGRASRYTFGMVTKGSVE